MRRRRLERNSEPKETKVGVKILHVLLLNGIVKCGDNAYFFVICNTVCLWRVYNKNLSLFSNSNILIVLFDACLFVFWK